MLGGAPTKFTKMFRCLQQAKPVVGKSPVLCPRDVHNKDRRHGSSAAMQCASQGPFADHLGLYHGSFANSLRSRLRIPATILSATPFSMLRFVGPKTAFLMVRSLILRRELREGFEPSHPQVAGGGKVERLLVAHTLGIPGVVGK